MHGIEKGMLPVPLWRQILQRLVADDCHFDHLIFQWLGDPSLHPQLPELVQLAVEHLSDRVGYLRIDTNAILLTPSKIDALLEAVSRPEAPTLLLVFTIDAAEPSTYRRVKGRDELPRVRRHIRHLIRKRKELGTQCRVNIQLQFVVQEGNAQEAGPFRDYWSDLLQCQSDHRWHDEILFKRLSVGGGGPGQAKADALYRTTIDRFGIEPGPYGSVEIKIWEHRPWQKDDGNPNQARSACPAMWLTPVIRHDGQLMMCCADLQGELALGSVADQGFRSLWEGRTATRRRFEQLDGHFNGVCEGCGGINWYSLTPEMVSNAKSRAIELGISPSQNAPRGTTV